MTDKKSKALQAVIIALITIAVGTGLILLSDANPVEAYSNFFRGIFGNLNGFCEVFVKATPLIFTGLGCAVAFRTGFFNIGAEGQFYVAPLRRRALPWDFPRFRGLHGSYWLWLPDFWPAACGR